MSKQETCAERWQRHYDSRIEDIRTLWTLYREEGPDASNEDLGSFDEYGLSFDYVAPGTFTDQDQGYFRYQISYGGPSEEFRFYTNPDFSCYRVEFWFLDWGDGEGRDIHDPEDRALMLEIFADFAEVGTVEHVYDKAMED